MGIAVHATADDRPRTRQALEPDQIDKRPDITVFAGSTSMLVSLTATGLPIMAHGHYFGVTHARQSCGSKTRVISGSQPKPRAA